MALTINFVFTIAEVVLTLFLEKLKTFVFSNIWAPFAWTISAKDLTNFAGLIAAQCGVNVEPKIFDALILDWAEFWSRNVKSESENPHSLKWFA